MMKGRKEPRKTNLKLIAFEDGDLTQSTKAAPQRIPGQGCRELDFILTQSQRK
jgi:hypothetical protein